MRYMAMPDTEPPLGRTRMWVDLSRPLAGKVGPSLCHQWSGCSGESGQPSRGGAMGAVRAVGGRRMTRCLASCVKLLGA